MKKFMSKAFATILALCMLLSVVFISDTEAAKTKKYTMILLEKDTLSLETNYSAPTKLKVSSKKICTAKKSDWKVLITGKKKGKTTVTFKDYKTTWKVTVKVLSLKDTKKKADKALKKKIKGLAAGTKYIYADLDKDGLKDLILQDKIWYYNYRNSKVQSRDNKYKDFYVGSKAKFYGYLKNPVYQAYLSDEDEATASNAEFIVLGEFVTYDDHYIFQPVGEGRGYRKYTEKGKKAYGQANDYAYYDYGYDQDDYEYISLTETEMLKGCTKGGHTFKGIEKEVPSGKLLTWTVK